MRIKLVDGNKDLEYVWKIRFFSVALLGVTLALVEVALI